MLDLDGDLREHRPARRSPTGDLPVEQEAIAEEFPVVDAELSDRRSGAR